MKTYNKIYKIINGRSTLSINFPNKGKTEFVTFKPNFGKKVGYFITNDPLVQYRIEKHPSFGKKFVLQKEMEIATTKQSEYQQRQANMIENQKFSFDDESSQTSIPERTLEKLKNLELRVDSLEKQLIALGIGNKNITIVPEPIEEEETTLKERPIPMANKEAEARKLQLEAEAIMDKDVKVEEVKTIQEGKNYILAYVKENNIPFERRGMTSLLSIQNKAKGLGLQFPNMK